MFYILINLIPKKNLNNVFMNNIFFKINLKFQNKTILQKHRTTSGVYTVFDTLKTPLMNFPEFKYKFSGKK